MVNWLEVGGGEEVFLKMGYKYELTGIAAGNDREGGEEGREEGKEGWRVSVKQLQVSDWHFALLVASLAHQPV